MGSARDCEVLYQTSFRISVGLLLCMLICAISTLCARAEIRKINFSKDYPSGTLLIPGTPFSKVAIGTVPFDVPAGAILELRINPHCIEHVERMAALPPSGIDRFYISYMSMEEDSDRCDKAIEAMPIFKHKVDLTCTRTDVSDAGVLGFKSLSMIEDLDCFMSNVTGSFLKDVKRLQNLKRLSLSNDTLKSENLKTLSQLPKLEYVDFSLSDLNDDAIQSISQIKNLDTLLITSNPKITDAGLQAIQRCTHLTRLNLRGNKNITDKCIPALLKLTNLEYLNLDSTKITVAGVEKLKDLKIHTLVLPQHFWKVDLVKLQKVFKPGVLKYETKEINKDIEVECAPLK